MRTDLLSAALRHARDARHLLEDPSHRSVDQAAHLAGFAPECALKACLANGRYDKALGHELADDAIAWVLALDPVFAARARRLPQPMAGWRPEIRYRPTGSVAQEQAKAWVESATEAVEALIIGAWLDGDLAEVPA